MTVSFDAKIDLGGSATVDHNGDGVAPADCPLPGALGTGTRTINCTFSTTIVQTPSQAGHLSPSAGVAVVHRPQVLGTVKGKVRAGKKGKLSIDLNKRGLALLKQRHMLKVSVVGTSKQGKNRVPVGGIITLRLR